MEDLKRVFFHELGHFIANEINHRFYGGSGTKSITLKLMNPRDGLYEGDTKINPSHDGKESKPASKECLPYALAAFSYGCFFQAYNKGESFKNCIDVNGSDDIQKWYAQLCANKMEDFNEDIHKVEAEYFDLLKNKQALDKMMKLDPQTYFLGHPGKYNVDLEKLRNDTSEFIDEHNDHFQLLIEKYQKVIAESIG